MASKTKSGLWRIQFYLTDEKYLDLLPIIKASGLTESAFFTGKITDEKQRGRGAPVGNRNAKKNELKDEFQPDSVKDTPRIKIDKPTSELDDVVIKVQESKTEPFFVSEDEMESLLANITDIASGESVTQITVFTKPEEEDLFYAAENNVIQFENKKSDDNCDERSKTDSYKFVNLEQPSLFEDYL